MLYKEWPSFLLNINDLHLFINYIEPNYQKAKSGHWKALGDLWRKNPDLLFTDRIKGFEMLFTSRQYAYVGVRRYYIETKYIDEIL